MNFEEIEAIVKKQLSENRFFHSKCVAKRCEELAEKYGVDKQKAKLIGIEHDIAKEWSEEKKIKYAETNQLPIDEIERQQPGLLHAKIGAHIGKMDFGFTEDMVEAISAHTTGKKNMNILAKILFIADATGDDRTWEDLEEVRKIANEDIDKAILYLLNVEIKDRINKDKAIHINSILARNELLFNGKLANEK